MFTQKEIFREYISAIEREKECIKAMRIIYAEKYNRLFCMYPKKSRKDYPAVLSKKRRVELISKYILKKFIKFFWEFLNFNIFVIKFFLDF